MAEQAVILAVLAAGVLATVILALNDRWPSRWQSGYPSTWTGPGAHGWDEGQQETGPGRRDRP